MTTYYTSNPEVEILHLDETGYGPEGKHTRREWRAECLRYFEAGAEAFLAWQESWQALAEQNELAPSFDVQRTFEYGSQDEVRGYKSQSHCLDFAGHIFEEDVNAQGYQFLYEAIFEQTTFTGKADFSKTTFTGKADFWETTFTGYAYFWEITFTRDASFRKTTFTRDASFRKTTFTGDASFRKATFTGDVNFSETTFIGNAHFSATTFTDKAYFWEATFTGDAIFSQTTFTDKAYFGKATFTGDAGFSNTTFTGDADFSNTTFTGDAYFSNTTFTGKADFGRTTFTGKAGFRKTTFTGYANFSFANVSNTTFTGKADFRETIFTDKAYFWETTFTGNADFRATTFTDKAYFRKTTFTGDADFSTANFEKLTDFLKAKFHNQTYFRDARFNGASNFENATFANVGHFEGATFNAPTSKIPSFRGVDDGSTLLEFSDDTHFTKSDFDEEAVKNIAFIKHLSEQHGQIDQALNFNAMELRAKYLQVVDPLLAKSLPWFKRAFKRYFNVAWWAMRPTWLYGLLSDFGRSYMRPLLAYGVVFVFTFIFTLGFELYFAAEHKPQNCRYTYEVLSLECDGKPPAIKPNDPAAGKEDEKLYLNGYRAAFEYANYHATGLVDFTGDSKLKDAITQRVFGEPIKPWWARIIGTLLSIINTALLFLIALGLRNSYRLK
ncbi:MAG: pentapeptide repeat-containing protein [Gallionella sp.]|nr:pentapeptide repeat-containing protein [Gallionella sp.]MDD4959889.1 pentapeptide repeat-containing protein [Gallionella sp.]